jgi:hypothetical protein
MEVSRAESFVCNSKIDPLNFKGRERRFLIDGMARDTGVTSHAYEAARRL